MVSDFGLCKCITSQTTTHISTKIKATRGYWDPDYIYINRVTRKSDVYAFGVVLLEVFCGRPPIDTRLEEEQISLILWAKMYMKRGKLDRIIDPSLNGETTPHSVKYFAKRADNCLHTQPKERPTMSKVVEILVIALASHELKGISQGTITKVFQGIKLVPKVMTRWWREGPTEHSFPDLIFDNIIQRVQYCRFSLAEIRAATFDFNKGLLISQDGYCRLYKGCLVGGTLVVAIKRFESTSLKEFSAEIQLQSLVRHDHYYSLVGFCNEDHELILVYEYLVNGTILSSMRSRLCEPDMVNGTLSLMRCRLLKTDMVDGRLSSGCLCDTDMIYGTLMGSHWKERLEKCIDIAQRLEVFHTKVEQQIYIIPILAFEVLSIPIHTGFETEGWDTDVCGMVEYTFSGNVMTKKSDVFAFGVMMLKVLCAKRRDDVCGTVRCEACLLAWVYGCMKRGTIDEVIDPDLIGKIAPKSFMYFVNIALSCLVDEEIQRPSLEDVLRGLQSSLQLQEAWENSIAMGDELRT